MFFFNNLLKKVIPLPFPVLLKKMALPWEAQRAALLKIQEVKRSFANGWPKFNRTPSVSHESQAEPIRSAHRAHSAPSTFPWHARVLGVCKWNLGLEFEGLR